MTTTSPATDVPFKVGDLVRKGKGKQVWRVTSIVPCLSPMDGAFLGMRITVCKAETTNPAPSCLQNPSAFSLIEEA